MIEWIGKVKELIEEKQVQLQDARHEAERCRVHCFPAILTQFVVRCKAKMKAHESQWEQEIARIEGMKSQLSKTLEAQQAKIVALETHTKTAAEEVKTLQVLHWSALQQGEAYWQASVLSHQKAHTTAQQELTISRTQNYKLTAQLNSTQETLDLRQVCLVHEHDFWT